jgi:hypothetical protein
VVLSIVISNIVRYFVIKYSIDTPLLHSPMLFSFTTGISSFLTIPSKITIETLFILDGKELDIIVGEYKILSNTNILDTKYMMVNGNKDLLVSSIPENTIGNRLPVNEIKEIPILMQI